VLRREALRLCDRYVEEVVVGFGLCPWAAPALRGGRVARAVVTDVAPAPEACLPIIDAWEAAPRVSIGLLVLPRFAGTRGAFDGFAEKVRRQAGGRRVGEPAFMVAAFHPEGLSTFAGPHQLVSFLRRTPDPLLQFVRAEALSAVKAGGGDVSGDVATQNHASLIAPGQTERFEAVISSLRIDRDATYARLGL
jgi:hypothetical protein